MTSRYPLARGRVSLGTVQYREKVSLGYKPWVTRSQSPLTEVWGGGKAPWASACPQPLPLLLAEPVDQSKGASAGGCSSFPSQCLFNLPMNFTILCSCLAPFSKSGKILCLGEREEKGQSQTKKGENIPGWRKGQGLPATSIQQNPQQNLSGSKGKVQRPGRARIRAGALPATLTQAKPATPSTTSSVRSSEAARPSGSCLGTWTMSQPKPPQAERERPGLARRAMGTKPVASPGPEPGGQEINACSSGHYTRSKVGGKGQEGNRKEGRLREKEAGLD